MRENKGTAKGHWGGGGGQVKKSHFNAQRLTEINVFVCAIIS